MRKSVRRYFLIILVAILFTQVTIAVFLRPTRREMFSLDYWRGVVEVSQVMWLLHRNYVKPEAVSYEQMSENAMRAILDDLDRYSAFMDKSYFEAFEMRSDQHYVGIGVEIERIYRRVTVTHVFSGSPAEAAGLQVGDQIVAVEEENTEEFTLEEISNRLRGEEGTRVDVTYYRPVKAARVTVEIERRGIDFPSVRRVQMLDPQAGIGYMQVTRFSRRSAEEVVAALKDLDGQGMQGLILDLRGNPGGLLDTAVDLISPFVADGEQVVSMKGRAGSGFEEVFFAKSELHWEGPLIVLIDEGSASASEIVSGALQDLRRAIVIGEKSVGKGSVQSVISLDSGNGVRFTTAMYFLPSGRTIHEIGVIPDIPVEVDDATAMKLYAQRSHLRELSPEAFIDRFGFEPVPDPQEVAALNLLRGMLSASRK